MVSLTAQTRHATTPGPSTGWNLHLGLIVAAVGLNLLSALIFEGFRPSAQFALPVILAIPPLVFGALASWKGRPWMYLTAGLTAPVFAFLVMALFGAWRGLFGPFATELVVAIMLLAVPALAIPNGILAYRAARAPAAAAATGARRRRVALVTAVAIAGILVGSGWSGAVFRGVETASAASGGYDFTPAARSEVVAKGVAFQSGVQVTAGEITEIVVDNQDTMAHTFTYEKDGVTFNHNVPASATTKFLVLFDEPGTITFRCLPHPGMEETLTVV